MTIHCTSELRTGTETEQMVVSTPVAPAAPESSAGKDVAHPTFAADDTEPHRRTISDGGKSP